jgi:hypothetical protein
MARPTAGVVHHRIPADDSKPVSPHAFRLENVTVDACRTFHQSIRDDGKLISFPGPNSTEDYMRDRTVVSVDAKLIFSSSNGPLFLMKSSCKYMHASLVGPSSDMLAATHHTSGINQAECFRESWVFSTRFPLLLTCFCWPLVSMRPSALAARALKGRARVTSVGNDPCESRRQGRRGAACAN